MTSQKAAKPLTPKQEAIDENTPSTRLRELAATTVELTKLVAKNPNAEPDLLRELGSYSDAAVRKNVVRNPNTPSDVLLKLAGQFPGELLDNPVFDLLLLENPNFLADLSISALRSLLKREKVPASFLEWAVDHGGEDSLLAVLANPKTPNSVLERIIQKQKFQQISNCEIPTLQLSYWEGIHRKRQEERVTAAKLHVNLAGEMMQGWHEAAQAEMQKTSLDQNWEKIGKLYQIGVLPDFLIPILSEDQRRSFAIDRTLTPGTMAELVKEEARHSEVRRRIAQHPNTPIQTIVQLLGDHCSSVREAVVQNPKLSFELQQQFQMAMGVVSHPETESQMLKSFASSQWAHIRLGVAGHSNTSVDVLSQLAQDPDSLVRVAVALNAKTPTSALAVLAKDLDPWIRKSVGCHPNVIVELLQELAQDTHPNGARLAVAINPKTPYDLLLEIAKTKDVDHQSFTWNLQSRTEKLDEMFLKQIDADLKSLVRNLTDRGIPAHMRRGFFCLLTDISSDWSFWLKLSNHATSSEELLRVAFGQHLSQHQRIRAIETLTQKPDSSAAMLHRLVNIADTEMKIAIACHPNVGISTLEQLAQSKEWAVKVTVAKHPNLPTKLLEKLATDKTESVRHAVAHNPNVPTIALAKLVQDKSSQIRSSAIAALLQRPDAPTDLREQSAIVQQPEASATALTELATSQWLVIQTQVAQHPNTPLSTLETLATHRTADIRAAVATNLNTSVTQLEQLLEDKDTAVRLAAVENPNLPIAILETLADSKKRPLNTAAIKALLKRRAEGASRFLEPYAKGSTPSLSRLAVFLHPLAPPALLAKNVRSLSWLERYAIAQNPNTPLATLKTLANDGNRVVRATAKETLEKSAHHPSETKSL